MYNNSKSVALTNLPAIKFKNYTYLRDFVGFRSLPNKPNEKTLPEGKVLGSLTVSDHADQFETGKGGNDSLPDVLSGVMNRPDVCPLAGPYWNRGLVK